MKIHELLAEQIHTKALACIEAQAFQDALDLLKQACMMIAHNPVFHNNMGQVLGDLERFTEALESFDKAIECDPSYASPRFNKAQTQYQINNLDAAFDTCSQMHELGLANAKGYYLWALVGHASNRHEQAKMAIDTALSLEPHNTYLQNERTRLSATSDQ